MANPVIDMDDRTSYVDRASVKDNIDDRLDFLTPTEVPFLAYIGFAQDAAGAFKGANSLKFPCTQTRHTWFNDELVPNVSSVATAFATPYTSLVVPDGESERFSIGDVVMIEEAYYLISNTNHSTNTLTVANIAGSDADAAVGTVVYLIGNAQVESVAASSLESRSTEFTSTENFTQIFGALVEISGTEMSTERWGVPGDPYEYQMMKKIKELGKQLELAAIYGRRNATYPSSNATRRRMGGVAEFVRDASGANSRDAGGNDLTETLLGTLLEDIWTDGGTPDTVMVPMAQKKKINTFLDPNIRVPRDEGVAGVIIGRYESDAGSLDVVLNRWMKPDDMIILTRSDIGIGPLTGNGNSRAFFEQPLPKDGDYERTMIIGEYTMEVRNALKAHGWYRNLSTS